MNASDLIPQRLANQRLAGSPCTTPAEAVAWLGAVQSQDYHGAKWALGLRLLGQATDTAIESAFNDGAFLRTHVLRPTWHFVAPQDIRWLLTLTAPRVHALNGYMYRQNGIDDDTMSAARRIIAGALEGGNGLTRKEIGALLERHGLAPGTGFRQIYILMRLELEALICSGPMKGKQQTYALLDERVPATRDLVRDEALAELATRYYTSHGPATARDLAWWSSLTLADARRATDLAAPGLERVDVEGDALWNRDLSEPTVPSPHALLLPAYDELVSHDPAGRQLMIPDGVRLDDLVAAGRVDAHHLVIDGRLAGGWRRRLTSRSVQIEIDPWRPLTSAERTELMAQLDRYAAFVARTPIVDWRG